MRNSVAVRFLLAWMMLAGPAAAWSQESVTLRGEVIDPALYLREGRHGAEAEDLIFDAVDAGQTLALLEDGTQTVYLFLAGESGEDPNDLLYEHVGRRVTVTGIVHERGGLKGIVPTAVEPSEPSSQPADTNTAQ